MPDLGQQIESKLFTSRHVNEKRAALLAVLELHQPNGTRLPECSECHQIANEYEPGPNLASPVDWPCPTVLAVARALGIQEA